MFRPIRLTTRLQRLRRPGLKWLMLLSALLLLVWLIRLDVFAQGREARLAGHYRMARVWFHIGALQGDGRAQNNLAGLYAEGLGGVRNDALAAAWFKRAADAGVAAARFNLANFYEEGRGVPQDTRRAAALFEAAALQGDLAAAFNLGQICAEGRKDFPKDLDCSLRWYRLAAERGFVSAQHNLASLYYRGEGLPQDVDAARQWWERAASHGHAKAQIDLGALLLLGQGVPRDEERGIRLLTAAGSKPEAGELARQRLGLLCPGLQDRTLLPLCLRGAGLP